MVHRSIGQEWFGFVGRERTTSSLDALASLIDWTPIAALLDPLYPAAKGDPPGRRWRCSRRCCCRSGTICPM